ncbi:unnamed protein product, partial [Phaeothamnion confervicola]
GEDIFSRAVRDVFAGRRKGEDAARDTEPADTAADGVAPTAGTAGPPPAACQSYALVVGMPGSGKSTLLNVYLNPNKDETPKPTVALDYMFARRTASVNAPKDVAHIWELGGGGGSGGGFHVAELVRVPITAANFHSALYVIVVDLSRPADVVPALLHWTDQVKFCVKTCVRELAKADPTFPERLKAQTFAKFGHDHPDRAAVKPCPVRLVVVASKYDVFKGADSALRRVVGQALRFIAHVNGASLVFCSAREKLLRDAFRLVMNKYLFRVGGAKRGSETNPDKPLAVSAGTDTFEAILKSLPPGTSRADFLAANDTVAEGAMAKWREAIAEYCGPPSEYAASGGGGSISGGGAVPGSIESKEEGADGGGGAAGGNEHPEAAVDELRAHKDEALQRYRREAERRTRL